MQGPKGKKAKQSQRENQEVGPPRENAQGRSHALGGRGCTPSVGVLVLWMGRMQRLLAGPQVPPQGSQGGRTPPRPRACKRPPLMTCDNCHGD